MRELKKNLRAISDFLTYFPNSWENPEINIWKNEIDVIFGDSVFLKFKGRNLSYEMGVNSGKIDLTNMEDRIRLVEDVKDFVN